ncbi:MBL fold metallo-hydrolase [bacterium]|nr:MBL fold metallo-hydrolase [bacterium]
MKLSFFGATREVTGSKFLLETNNKKILVDCGLHQGSKDNKETNYEPFPFDPSTLDMLLLTHAHIDHSGLIPKLVKDGFTGKIITTKATFNLCSIMLLDSGHIQETENEWDNRKRRRKGLAERPPLYTVADAQESLKYFQGESYGKRLQIGEDIFITFRDAGHILGSAHILLESEGLKIGFSGDIGSVLSPVLNEPSSFEDVDYLIMESTYGNRGRHKIEDSLHLFSDIVEESLRSGGKILVPSFAIGRTQMLMYYLNQLLNEGKINLIKVFLDSPLAIKATKIYGQIAKSDPEYFSRNIIDLKKDGDPFGFPSLSSTQSVDESRSINEFDKPAMIISAAGMCNAGRILHHLKHNLWNPNTSVVFVGYQAQGTLGKLIQSGRDNVSIFGEPVEINASIYSLDSFSAHADAEHLASFAGDIPVKPKGIFIVHGEEEAQKALQDNLKEKYDLESIIPSYAQGFSIDKSGIELVDTGAEPLLITVEDKNKILADSLDLDEGIEILGKRLKTFVEELGSIEDSEKKIAHLAVRSEKALILLKRFSDLVGAAVFDSYDQIKEEDEIVDTKFQQKIKEFRKEYFLSIDPVIQDFIEKVNEILKPTKK